jgi:hypothetical protein
MNIFHIAKMISLVWSIMMGAEAVLNTYLGNTHDILFYLGCGTMSYFGFELNRLR